MVRVISVYHFMEQLIDTVQEDIVDADIISAKSIILAKSNQIEIKNLNDQDGLSKESCLFSTVDDVQKIIYSKTGNYIATLETNDCDNNFCRIYVNWDASKTKHPKQISARIAGKVTPNNARCGMMEMIELPFMEQPMLMSICQATGNILVSSGQFLYIYKFKQCDKKKYIDFEECEFRIELEFEPQNLQICEHLIAASSAHSFLLIRLTELSNSMFSCDADSDDTSAKSDNISDSFLQHDTNLSETLDFEKISQQTYINGELLRVPLKSSMIMQSDNNYASSHPSTDLQNEVQLTVVNDIKFAIQYLLANGEYSNGTVDCHHHIKLHPILQLKLSPIQVDETIHFPDAFVCFKMRPLYIYENQKEDIPVGIFSKFKLQFQGVRLVLCTKNDGYFYETSDSCHLNSVIHYPFLNSIEDVIITDTVLHVATDFGLETYSLPKLNVQRDSKADRVSHRMSNFENPCLLGLRPFLYLKKIFFNLESNVLVLLANSNTPVADEMVKDNNSADTDMLSETKNFFHKAISKSISVYTGNSLPRKCAVSVPSSATASWTIYNLQCPSIPQLYCDFVDLANRNYKKSSLAVYAHLLLEAHSILYYAKFFANIKMAEISCVELRSEWENHTELEALYEESCLNLGDYFVRMSSEFEYKQALSFYMKANIDGPAIFSRTIKTAPPRLGLIWTLQKYFGELMSSNADMIDILNRPVEVDDKMVRFGDAFLELLAEEKKSSIAELFLSSEVLREHLSEKVYEILLRDSDVRSNEDIVCIMLHLIRKDDIKTARKLLAQIPDDDLRPILLKNWLLLFDPAITSTATSFSYFTEICFLQNPQLSYQNILVNVLLDLILDPYNHYVEFDGVLKNFVDYMSGLAGSPKYGITCQLTIQFFLEQYFSRLADYKNDMTYKGLKLHNKLLQTQQHADNAHLTPLKSETTTTTSSYLLGGTSDNVDGHEYPSIDETSSSNVKSEQLSSQKFDSINMTNAEGMKILIRIYLGQLRMFSMKQNANFKANPPPDMTIAKTKNTTNQNQHQNKINFKIMETEINQFLLQARNSNGYDKINRILCAQNTDEMSGQSDTVLCLDERWDYLNLLPPFFENLLSKYDGFQSSRTVDASNDNVNLSKADRDAFLKTVVKIQCLLCNKKNLTDETRREVLQFLLTNNDVLGSDLVVALKICILNKQHSIDLLIKKCPQGCLAFAKNRFKLDTEWSLLIKMLKEKIVNYEICDANCHFILIYQKILREILEYIATNKPLEVVLKIFPPAEIVSKPQSNSDDDTGERSADPIIEANASREIFDDLDDYIRLCVDKESSEKLSIMIVNTGHQLWNLVKHKNT